MPGRSEHTNSLAEHYFRHSYARLVSLLVKYFGLKEVEVAEDIVHDTLVEAMEQWSIRSIPDNPDGWLTDVAKKKTINYLRRNQLFHEKIAHRWQSDMNTEPEEDIMARMIFTCCHPDLPTESQVALALKTLCGLSVAEIASALLTNEATINKRLYRAKQKFRDGTIAYTIPNDKQLSERLDSVYTTLYLLFSEGYYSSHHEIAIRMDLCYEAVRLLKQIISSFGDSAEGKALLALMLFNIARFESRLDATDGLISLTDQNRQLWDLDLIAEGINYLLASKQTEFISRYHLLAGISAEHCIADSFKNTNWDSIYRQYSILEKVDNNVIVTFNKCIAQYYYGKRNEALNALLSLEDHPFLRGHSQYYLAMGTFYSELNETDTAVSYLKTALQYCKSDNLRSYILRKLES